MSYLKGLQRLYDVIMMKNRSAKKVVFHLLAQLSLLNRIQKNYLKRFRFFFESKTIARLVLQELENV